MVAIFDKLGIDLYRQIPICDIRGARMAKNTGITLGDHCDGFIAQQIADGRHASASEVVRAGLRILEDNEQKVATLRRLLEEGEQSGTTKHSYESFMNELDDDLS